MKIVPILCSLTICGAIALKAADEPKKPAEGDKPKATGEELFKKADTNNDGSLSKEEFVAAFGKKDAAKGEEKFKQIDTNSDGKISAEEWKARPHDKKKEAK